MREMPVPQAFFTMNTHDQGFAFSSLGLGEKEFYTVVLFLHSLYKASNLKTLCNHVFTLPSACIPIKHSSLKGRPDAFYLGWGWLRLLSKSHTGAAARNSP